LDRAKNACFKSLQAQICRHAPGNPQNYAVRWWCAAHSCLTSAPTDCLRDRPSSLTVRACSFAAMGFLPSKPTMSPRRVAGRTTCCGAMPACRKKRRASSCALQPSRSPILKTAGVSRTETRNNPRSELIDKIKYSTLSCGAQHGPSTSHSGLTPLKMPEGGADAAAETILRDGLTHSIIMRCAHSRCTSMSSPPRHSCCTSMSSPPSFILPSWQF